MRIAVIGTKGIPAKHGGIERHCEELYSRLAKRGHEITIFVRPQYVDAQIGTYKGITLKPLPAANSKNLEAITHTLGGSIAALFGNFDVVHYHGLGPTSLSWMLKLRPGVRVVSTCHGLDWQRAKWGAFAKAYLKSGEWVTTKVPNSVICVSRYLSGYFQEKYGLQTAYIPNGINMPAEKVRLDGSFDLKPNDYFLFVGRLTPEKGVHYAIDAFKKTHTKKKFVVAGGSSNTDGYVDRIKQLAGSDKRILFTDYVYGRALQMLYSNAYAFVLPSDIEGLPISLLEAISYGKPAITSDIDPNVEVMGSKGEFGYVFRRGCVDDLYEKIEIALGDSDLAKKGEHAERYVAEHYDWDQVAVQTENLYLSLFGDSKEVRDLNSEAHTRTIGRETV